MSLFTLPGAFGVLLSMWLSNGSKGNTLEDVSNFFVETASADIPVGPYSGDSSTTDAGCCGCCGSDGSCGTG